MKKGREAAFDLGRAWLAVMRGTISASPQQSTMPSPDGKCTRMPGRSRGHLFFQRPFFQNSMAISPRQLAWCAHYHDQGTVMREGYSHQVRLRGASHSYHAKAVASCLPPHRRGSHRSEDQGQCHDGDEQQTVERKKTRGYLPCDCESCHGDAAQSRRRRGLA